MISGRKRFNIYLLLALALAACGCQTNKEDKELSTIRVHLQTVPEIMDFSKTVPIFRAHPVMVTIDTSPFLTEANVAKAEVVDVLGGFELRIEFDRQGTWILENYSASNPGKHYAVFSQFGKTSAESRWLAAPIFSRRISNGVLTFTPDATRAEAERIAIGLNNVAKKNREESKW